MRCVSKDVGSASLKIKKKDKNTTACNGYIIRVKTLTNLHDKFATVTLLNVPDVPHQSWKGDRHSCYLATGKENQ